MSVASYSPISPPCFRNTALVVVTYNPDKIFISCIQKAVEQFKLAILVDNSETEQPALQILDGTNVQVILNGRNVGLGSALNTGCQRALENRFEWVVTLDQDSELYPNFLESMVQAWKVFPSSTTVLGCNYHNADKSHYRFPPADEPSAKQVTTVITSGCMIHLPSWLAIGRFRSDYFIDSIDHEFCLRTRRAQLNVGINRQALMAHTIGEKLAHKTALANLIPHRHSVWRMYTNARNTTRTVIDYGYREPLWGAKRIIGMLYELLTIVVFEPDKRIRLRAYFTGIGHGLQGKIGSIPSSFKRTAK